MNKRAHRSYTDYEKLEFVERFEKSEKTARAFCREEDLPKSSLSDWITAKNEGRLTAENCSGGKRKNRPTAKSPLEGTFYRRELGSPAVSFSSPEGRVLFRDALGEGNIEGYFKLSEGYLTQGHPAFCGIGSLTMALNALLVDPQRAWQGVWRWFDESMLDCCQPHDVTRLKGISIPKLACLARCNGVDVAVKYASDITVEEFRRDVVATAQMNAARTDPHHNANRHHSSSSKAGSSLNSAGSSKNDGTEFPIVMIANYCRTPLSQTGDGHFSPIGGYHSGKDMLLIMDVARFKYPPHWVPLPLFFEAMQQLDAATGSSRGYLLLQPTSTLKQRLLHCKSQMGKDCSLFEEEDDKDSIAVGAASSSNVDVATAAATSIDSPRQSKKRRIVEERMEALEHCAGDSAAGNGISVTQGTPSDVDISTHINSMSSFFGQQQQIQLQLQQRQHQHQQLHQRHQLQQQQLQPQQLHQQLHHQQQHHLHQQRMAAANRNGIIDDLSAGAPSNVNGLMAMHHSQQLHSQSQQHMHHQHQSAHQQLQQHIQLQQQQQQQQQHHGAFQQMQSAALNHMVLPMNSIGLSGDLSMLQHQGNMSTLQMGSSVILDDDSMFRTAAAHAHTLDSATGNKSARKNNSGRPLRPGSGNGSGGAAGLY